MSMFWSMHACTLCPKQRVILAIFAKLNNLRRHDTKEIIRKFILLRVIIFKFIIILCLIFV